MILTGAGKVQNEPRTPCCTRKEILKTGKYVTKDTDTSWKGVPAANLEIFEQNNDSSGYIIILNEVIHEFTLINK